MAYNKLQLLISLIMNHKLENIICCDIAAIHSTPLVNLEDQDQLAWKFTPTGTFSVHTSYHYIMESRLDIEAFEGEWQLGGCLET